MRYAPSDAHLVQPRATLPSDAHLVQPRATLRATRTSSNRALRSERRAPRPTVRYAPSDAHLVQPCATLRATRTSSNRALRALQPSRALRAEHFSCTARPKRHTLQPSLRHVIPGGGFPIQDMDPRREPQTHVSRVVIGANPRLTSPGL